MVFRIFTITLDKKKDLYKPYYHMSNFTVYNFGN